MTQRVRVVTVDDSSICRALLADVLEAEGDIEVVGEASDGTEALAAVRRDSPDLVTMDILMPNGGGLAAIEAIMAERPVPILVVTSQPTGGGSDLLFQAVRRGALDLAEKPSPYDPKAAAALRSKVRQLSRVAVVRHVAGRRTSPLAASVPPVKIPSAVPPPAPIASAALPRAGVAPCPVVAIAASAGGPAAVAAVLAELPRELSAAIALVQHLPVGFTEPFARFLRGATRLPIRIVDDAAEARPGTVYVPTDGRHLVAATPLLFKADPSPPVRGHRPSATVLFRSMARVHGAAGVGIVLTGIGDDGAEGLAEMRARGALTIAQDAATAVVYGMPEAAVRAGAVAKSLGLAAITDTLRAMFDPRRARSGARVP